jgi:hypothetical protein
MSGFRLPLPTLDTLVHAGDGFEFLIRDEGNPDRNG